MLEKRLDPENPMHSIDPWRMRTQPTIVNLLSYCGGLSLGSHRAGFRTIAGVEIEPRPAKTHALNFLKGAHR